MSIKLAVIGCGVMADYHLEGYRKAGADVVAVVDRNPLKAEAYAEKWKIPYKFHTIKELFDVIDVDGVSIITPNCFHKEMAIETLERGAHVFCEKPPALNADEVVEMKNAADKAGKILTFNFNNRIREESKALMEYIRHGEIGRINSAQAVWIRRAGIPGFGGWFTNRAVSGGGPLIDLIHMLDLALYFMGYPEPDCILAQTFRDFISNKDFKGVWGIPDVENGVTDVENACHGFIRFKTGQVLFVRSSWAEMIQREEVYVTLQGTKAGAFIRRRFDADGIDLTCIDESKLFTCEHGRQVNRNIITPKDPTMGRTLSPLHFVNAIRGLEKPLVTPDEAIRLMRIIDGIYRSAAEGRAVNM